MVKVTPIAERISARFRPIPASGPDTPSFDREARDALRRTPVLLFDPAGHLTAKHRGQRAAFPRLQRRHYWVTVTDDKGARRQVERQIPRRRRVRGTMASATKLDLAQARASL